MLQKLRDAISALVQRLTGKYQTQAKTALAQLNAALDASAELEKSGEVQKNTDTSKGDGGVKHSLKTVNGKPIVWIGNSALSNKELNNANAVAAYIATHIGEVYTIIESGQKVYIGKDLPGEYTHSKYTDMLRKTRKNDLRSKNKAVNELGLLIETATNRRWEKTKHPNNKDAKYGMYRYDSAFAFPVKGNDGKVANVKAYDVQLVIRNASDGKKYLYDIVDVLENTTTELNLLQREISRDDHEAATRDSVSDEIVPQNKPPVKPQASLKGTEDAKTIASLKKERDVWKGRTEHLRAELKKTDGITLQKGPVYKVAKKLAKSTNSTVDVEQLCDAIYHLYDKIARGNIAYENIYAQAQKIGLELAENSMVDDTSYYEEYGDVRDFMKKTALQISEADRRGISLAI